MSPRPGLYQGEIQIYISIRWLESRWLPLKAGHAETLTWPYGSPGLPTLWRHIVTLLRTGTNKLLVETISGNDCQLVSRSNPGPMDHHVDPVGANLLLTQTIRWDYTVKIDNDTGRISNIVRAGG